MKPNLVAFVFARGGSKGVPRKNLRLAGGKSLLARSIETALASRWIDRVVVSTDDEEIAAEARRWGAHAPFLRPAELSSDTASEWHAWRHAIRFVESEAGQPPLDALVSVPATSPLRATADVDAAIECYLAGDADTVITVTPAARSPYFNMVTVAQDGAARLVIQSPGQVIRRQDAPAVFDITTVAYVARPAFVLESDGIFSGRVKAVVVPSERAIDIDSEHDLRVADLLLRDEMTRQQGDTSRRAG